MMNALEAKVLFELNKDGKITIEVRGNKSAVKAGLLSIVERIADIEEVPMEDYIDGMRAVATFSNLFGGDDEEPARCAGDRDNCDRHEEMPQEMKEFFDKMFGGLN